GHLGGIEAGFERHRRAVEPQPAHHEDEQVDPVGHQQQAGDDLEGPRPQDQPGARAEQHADGDGDDGFHQDLPPSAAPSSSVAGALRWLRTDWWASAISISMVVPTTTANTPRSNRKALGKCTSPSSGSLTCAVCEVRKGWPNSHAPMPVPPASSRP